MFEPPTHTGVDDVHAHPRHVGHRSLDLILALTAIFISGVSLYVAMEHGRIEQQLVRENAQLVQANSWPFLQLDAEYSDQEPTRIALVNAGIGPAKLERFTVSYQGRPVSDIQTLLTQCCGLPADRAARKTMLPNGLMVASPSRSVIRPGEQRPLIVIEAGPDRRVLADAFLKASRSITYEACYCSVFDVCWMSSLTGLRPREIAACPQEGRDFNQDSE